MKKNALLCLLYLVISFPGCGKLDIEIQENDILKISVLTSGKILLNGQKISLKKLPPILQELKDKNGEVWYHRENSQQDPPEQATQVIQMVIDAKIPISLSSQPDFSDYIDGLGQSHPRLMAELPLN